ncbi:hypothetical protein BC835DRAFT_1305247 [Cytidiella melzeri]|nr:hypothetical protein BC835DRAFT_1305247 [Cytidiella melzeri]
MSQDLSYMTLPSDEDPYDQTDPDDERFDDALNPATTQLRLLCIGSRGRDGPSSASSHRAQPQGARSATVNTELAEALYQTQDDYAALRERLMQSEQEKQALSDKLYQVSRRRKGQALTEEQTEPPSLKLQERKVAECGKKYALIHRPWASKDTCNQLGEERPLVDLLNVKDRFRDKQTQEKAHLAEMWDILAANPIVKPLLGSAKWLPKKFHAMVQDEKSKFVAAASTNIVDIFGSLGISRESLVTGVARKNCAALQDLGPQGPNDLYCPALFADGHPTDHQWLFRTKRIVVVIQSGILGKGSPRGPKATNTLSKAYQWGIKEVTPGLIAFAAVVLIYLISGDDAFAPKGSTKTVTYDYISFFDCFLKLLIQNHRTPNSKALFEWLNFEVFGSTGGSLLTIEGDDSDDETDAHNLEIEAMFGLAGDDSARRGPSPPLDGDAPRSHPRGGVTPPLSAALRPPSRAPSPPLVIDAPCPSARRGPTPPSSTALRRPSRAPSPTRNAPRSVPSRAPSRTHTASRSAPPRSPSPALNPPRADDSRARSSAPPVEPRRRSGARTPMPPVDPSQAFFPVNRPVNRAGRISRPPSPIGDDIPLVPPGLALQPQGAGAGRQSLLANAHAFESAESEDQPPPPNAVAPKQKRNKRNAAHAEAQQEQSVASRRVLRTRS